MARIKVHLIGLKELILEVDDADLGETLASLIGKTTDDDTDDEEDSAGDARAETVINPTMDPPPFGFTPWSTNQTMKWLWEEDRKRGSSVGQQPKRPKKQ